MNLRTVVALISFLALHVSAQTPGSKPSFDVVSVRPSTSNENWYVGFGNGRFSAVNASARDVLRFAFGPPDAILMMNQLSGGPSWIDSDRFNITAQPEDRRAPPSQEQMKLMVQSLLEDRFKLKAHVETRNLPVFNLTIGSGGSKLKRSEDPPAPSETNAPPGLNTPPRGGFRMNGMPNPSGIALRLTGTAVTIAALNGLLQQYAGRPIVDKTNLKDLYDVSLEFNIDARQSGDAAVDPSGISSLFGAVQQQLGLRLEAARGPVEVLVIESIQKPDEN